MALPIKYIHQVEGKPIYSDHEEVIEALAELAGFRAYEVKGFNDEHEGYIIEPEDLELRKFLEAEIASEKCEDELVGAMGSYLEEE